MRPWRIPLAGVAFLGLLAVAVAGADSRVVVVAGLKLIPIPRDKEANYLRFERQAREAAAAGAHLLVTSECYLDGYLGNPRLYPDMTPENLRKIAEPVDGPYVRRASALAKELRVFIVFGFSERRGDKVYNTAALIAPEGQVLGTYSKSHLGEESYEPGREFPVFATAAGRIGLLICFDRQVPETSRMLALKGAEMILIPTNSRNVELINEDIMLRVRAYENNVFVAMVSPVNTVMVDPEGEIMAREGDRQSERVIYARFDLAKRAARRDAFDRRHPELYGELVRPR